VLVCVDACRLAILLTREGVAILRSEVAVIGGAHTVLFAVDGAFAVLKMRGLAGSQLPAAIALRDAVLLVNFAAGDVVSLGIGGLCEGGCR
jgi:hypothetical protein